MDGRLLGLARKEKERIRQRAEAENDRRHAEVYARVPAIRALDERIAALMGEAVNAALGGPGRSMDELQRESIDLQAERAERLVENGWPIDYLDGAWQCPKCRDTGFVEGRACPCLLTLYEAEKAKDLSALLRLGDESFGSFDLGLYSDRPDPATGISPRETMELVFDTCCDYALGFGPDSQNLLFRGGTGLGKTFLSACIARVVSERGHSVVYETAVDALGAFESLRFARTDEVSGQAGEKVRRLLDSELVIVDDLGTEMVTEMTKSALYTLINSRLLANRKTIISTNLSSRELARRYTPQIVSRLEGEYQVLSFAGSDIRQIKKERGLD